MAKRQKARGAGEASVPPAPSSSERERLEAAVASLSGLNADQLRLQWRNHLGGIPPAHLPGWLLARVLAYRIQAAAFGDLDRAILRRLREMKGEALESGQARPFATRGPTTREGVGLSSGALLVREWNGRIERVMVFDEGYAWNGGVYRSLSQAAKAITGTNWNGHRFFGLKGARNGSPIENEIAAPTSNAALDTGVSHPRTGPNRAGGPTMKQGERKIALRCAVYTRVSTDSGLEQDFNSLDNQREASEAYIKSQAHEGWKLVRERYDDGGFSGGSMERPALQKLLDDVLARRIDVIVVYKVDRLTRSLADFAKLVELFDAHGVSFISVTQAFNTTTSMGRLTLNMLLSFAQFEREITGERIRDKVAASKRKGIWMGGAVPLGYRVEDRALHVVEDEAEFVRNLFRRYLELGSVVRLKTALDAENVRSPVRTSRTGRKTGGAPISRGHLYWILSNPIYVGRLRHKGQIHDGLHPAIVDVEIWERVQQRLASQTQPRRPSQPDDHSFLVGKLYDDRGNRMGASHASKGGRRWRYYVSRAALSGRWKEAGSVVRIPAPEIENRIANAVGAYLAARANAIDGCHIDRGDGRGDYAITQHEFGRMRRDLPSENDVRNAIGRATVSATRIEIVLNEFDRLRGAGSGLDAALDPSVLAPSP